MITIACTLVGLFGAGITATWIIFGGTMEDSRIYDEMFRECEEKYYDPAKIWVDQGKEFRDCIDRIDEVLGEK